MLSIVVLTLDNIPLSSTLFTPEYLINNCTTSSTPALSLYSVEPNAYSASVYYSNNVLYIKSISVYDKAALIAF